MSKRANEPSKDSIERVRIFIRRSVPGTLTAKQLQQAIDMVEGKLGAERSQDASASVGAVLLTLAENYRQRRIRST